MRNQPLQIHFSAAYELHRFLLQLYGSTIGTQQTLLIHTNRGGIYDGLSSYRLGE